MFKESGDTIKYIRNHLVATRECSQFNTFRLKREWNAICASEVDFAWPENKWEYDDWRSHKLNAAMIYNAIRLLKPKVLVETGTFEGHGTYVMAQAAHENNNNALIITIDYDDDPITKLPKEDWFKLSAIREQKLTLIRAKFSNCEVCFVNGDSREVLPMIFKSKIDFWDFFYQDTMHFPRGILAEWRVMRKFARLGSVAVFDDIYLNRGIPSAFFRQRKDFCSWFVWHEFLNGWTYVSTEIGHKQFWVQKLK